MDSADTRGVESIESAVRTLALLPGRRPAFGRLSQPLSEAPSHQADGPRFDREPTHSAAASAIRRRQILSTRFDPWPRRSRRALAARDGFVERRHKPGEAAKRAPDGPGVKSNDASAHGGRNQRRRDSEWQCNPRNDQPVAGRSMHFRQVPESLHLLGVALDDHVHLVRRQHVAPLVRRALPKEDSTLVRSLPESVLPLQGG